MIPERPVSARLADSRVRAALSPAQAAARLGLPSDLVLQWESGSRRPASPYLIGLAALYGVSVDYLTHGAGPPVGAALPATPARAAAAWWFVQLDRRPRRVRRKARRSCPSPSSRAA